MVAVGHSVLVIAYHVLQGPAYQDLGRDFFDRLSPERTTRRLVKRLEDVGHQVSPTPKDAVA